MSTPNEAARAAQGRGGHTVLTLLVLALVWWTLAGGSWSSWSVGVPLLLACFWLVHRLPSEGPWLWRPAGMVRFLGFFLWQSVLSGVQVAWLALHPRVPLAPELVYYDLRLPATPPRVFFANAVSLLPGTLSCILTDDFLVIHTLKNGPAVAAGLARLEDRVAGLFGPVPVASAEDGPRVA